ncbi:hypothetical protein GA0115240_152318 [Streptomyces sp. DvalAA-14]|uniref:hypothetical protein n=1 Tax=unclassified Streptomyces TaxID=2593676 RepID=UPI00081B4AAE|nr:MULTISPECIES: hypothetical protein [unclassified Streptomyces]MYS23376.1 hypothetical protein [Streptomyces sp. SID4948]SCE32374.1 hypothetical protein GA0115240_152318 [Streptomyces sp. DvalAA-14]
MAKRDQDGPDLGPLEIRAGGLGRLLAKAMLPATALVLQAVVRDGFAGTIDTVICAFVGAMVLGVGVRHVRWRSKGCLVRLDEAGVTLTGVRTVGWAEIREVREVHRNAWEGLVFLPQDDAVLPMFDIPLFVLRRRTRRDRRTRLWGSPLVLSPMNLDASRTQIVDAVRRFSGGVPILDEKRELVVS